MNIGKKFERTLYQSWESTGRNLTRLRLTDTMAERPCDELVLCDGKSLFIEAKSTTKTRFNFRNIGTHQIRSLKHLHMKQPGMFGLFFIEFSQSNKMVAISITTLLDFIRDGKGSASLHELREVGVELIKQGDYYPVERILDKVGKGRWSK